MNTKTFFSYLNSRHLLSPAPRAFIEFFVSAVILLVGNGVPDLIAAFQGSSFNWILFAGTTLFSALLLACAAYQNSAGRKDVATLLQKAADKESGQNVTIAQVEQGVPADAATGNAKTVNSGP